MSNWRNTRDYRLWRIKVIRRDKVCKICGSRKYRHAHHLKSGSYFKEYRYEIDNGVCLCRHCHLTLFHSYFMGSSRKKTTEKDYYRFKKLINNIKGS